MEDLVTITANLDSREDPLIVRMGITKQAEALMLEMLKEEPRPVSNERWNQIMFEVTRKFPVVDE
jgi:hypothetical protein